MKLDRKLNFGGKNRLEGNLVELRLWEEDGEVQGLMAPGKSMGLNHIDCGIHIERVCAGRPGDACTPYSDIQFLISIP